MSKRAPPVTTVKSAAQHQAELKKQAAKALKTKARKHTQTGKIKCPLCGLPVPRSAMLGHKMSAHGELLFDPTPKLPHSENLWVPIYRGGATGLKK